MQRVLIALGLILLLAGLLWPLFGKLGLGRLPGDIAIERDGHGFYLPITTCIAVSAVLSVLLTAFLWILRKLL